MDTMGNKHCWHIITCMTYWTQVHKYCIISMCCLHLKFCFMRLTSAFSTFAVTEVKPKQQNPQASERSWRIIVVSAHCLHREVQKTVYTSPAVWTADDEGKEKKRKSIDRCYSDLFSFQNVAEKFGRIRMDSLSAGFSAPKKTTPVESESSGKQPTKSQKHRDKCSAAVH